MTVQEMISTHFDMTTPDYQYIVKPSGTGRNYYHGNGHTDYMHPEIREKKIERWLVDTKQKYIVMIVEQDKTFEEKREKAWENLKKETKKES